MRLTGGDARELDGWRVVCRQVCQGRVVVLSAVKTQLRGIAMSRSWVVIRPRATAGGRNNGLENIAFARPGGLPGWGSEPIGEPIR
jgi:hypothetical protein